MVQASDLLPSLIAVLSTASALSGCDDGAVEAGNYALSFAGYPSCMTVPMGQGTFPTALTAEVWVQGDSFAGAVDHPLFSWTGAFHLYEEADGGLQYTDGLETSSVSYGQGTWMDGEWHHVAATWTGEHAELFLDGRRVGLNDLALGADPALELDIGCRPGADAFHEGLIDEVRLSSRVRYESDFEPAALPFAPDEGTVGLWHLDEGQGETARDAVGAHDASLVGTGWVPRESAEDTGT